MRKKLEKEIEDIQRIDTKIKKDLDGVLDCINRLNKLKSDYPDMPDYMKTNLDESLVKFKDLLAKYSNLLNVNEKSMKTAVGLLTQVYQREIQ